MSATGDYLKTASAYLVRAYEARRTEANYKRTEIVQKQEDLRRQVDDLEQEKRDREETMADSDTDDSERINKIRQVNDLENKIQEAKRNFEAEKARLTQEIDEVEDDAQDIKQKADDFMNRAAMG